MIGEEELMAYADGELTGADKARVEAALAADADLRTRLGKHRRLRSLLQQAYAPVLDEEVPAQLVEAVQAPAAPAPVIDLAAARAKRAPILREWRTREWGAMAAVLIVGVLVGGPMMNRDGLVGDDMVAKGALARALETQLAADEGAVRIGVSFRTADGAACRTFVADRGALSGLACKEDGAWRIDMALRGERKDATAFRMAAAETPPTVLARVEELAGEQGAMDASAERAARDRSWRD